MSFTDKIEQYKKIKDGVELFDSDFGVEKSASVIYKIRIMSEPLLANDKKYKTERYKAEILIIEDSRPTQYNMAGRTLEWFLPNSLWQAAADIDCSRLSDYVLSVVVRPKNRTNGRYEITFTLDPLPNPADTLTETVQNAIIPVPEIPAAPAVVKVAEIVQEQVLEISQEETDRIELIEKGLAQMKLPETFSQFVIDGLADAQERYKLDVAFYENGKFKYNKLIRRLFPLLRLLMREKKASSYYNAYVIGQYYLNIALPMLEQFPDKLKALDCNYISNIKFAQSCLSQLEQKLGEEYTAWRAKILKDKVREIVEVAKPVEETYCDLF